jgi:nucleoside phosphorylase
VTCDLLVLAAFHPELAPLHPTLGDGMRARVGGRDVAARVVGIGLPMAAVGAAMQLTEMQPRVVLLVGTCGAYPGSGLSLGEAVAARRVRLVSHAVVDGAAQFPEPMSIASDAHAPTLEALARAGGRVADVATTLAITIDDATASRVARASGAHVEHLEAHGVASACAARGIPFGAVLGVANAVGPRAREEWRMHHRAAASAAADVLLRWLHDEPSPSVR